jgi:hypothetical protein
MSDSYTINVPATEGGSSDLPKPLITPISSSSGEPSPDPSLGRFNNWAFEIILHEHFDKLRGRLMDIAECSTRDRQQARAMQALMKDALNTAFHDSRRNMETFCRDKGVIGAGEGLEHGPGYGLRADSIAEFIYEQPR